MSGDSSIEWTDATWNPTTGCDKVSPGCDHCYAMTLAPRLKAMGSAHYQTDGDPRTSGPGFGVTMHADALDWPLRKKKPLRIFVNSMSDLFHQGVSDEFIARVFAAMTLAPQHTFQVLTKRHARMRSLLNSAAFYGLVRAELYAERGLSEVDAFATERFPLPNVWLGVSVEDQHWAGIRIPALLETPAAVRFLSCEPLLGRIDFAAHGPHDMLDGIDWVIVGGESGPGARPMQPDWVRSIRDQCDTYGSAFHFKQWGEWVTEDQSPEDIVLPATGWSHLGGDQPTVYRVGKKRAGRELDGRTWDEFPEPVNA